MIRVICQGIRLYIDPADVLYAQRPGDEHDAVARLQGGAVKLPDGAIIGSRMHLSQDQVRALLPHLQAFAESGEFAFDPLSA